MLEQWVVALRDTEQRRFAAILTTLSSPTPFEAEISQAEAKKRDRWSGKEKIVEHLLDGFFIASFFDIFIDEKMKQSISQLRCITALLKIHQMLSY